MEGREIMFFSLRSKQDVLRCIAYIGSLGLLGHKWCVKVEEYKPKRSLAQNRCFHSWCGEMAKHKGYSPDEMKILVKHHLGLHEYVTNKKTGEVVPSLRSTTDLSVEEMMNVLTQMEVLAARDGIILQRGQDYFEAMGTESREGRQAAVGHGVPHTGKQYSEQPQPV
jgi:hypothetical protein